MSNPISKRTRKARELRDERRTAKRSTPEAVTQLLARRDRTILELSAQQCGMVLANAADKGEPWRGYLTEPRRVAQPYSERMDVPTFQTRMKLGQGEAQRIAG
jgi:hypothetical protein